VKANNDTGTEIVTPFLPFALPDIGEEEISEVVDTLRSGWITTGPKTRQFEQEFAQFLGGELEAVAVNSATAGLHLAVEALGISEGDEVIVPTHTFTATAEVIRYLGADPVFVDIGDADYCLSLAGTADAIGPRTRAILPVHYAGHAADMIGILRVAEDRGLGVIEDAAHALPSLCGSQLIGTLSSSATVFSFYATKTIATGEGGMLVTRDPKIARRARVMRLHGIDRDAFDRYTSSRPSWYYEIVAAGYKYNMTDIAASLGIHQLRKARRFLARRAEIARRYDEELAQLPLVLPPRPADHMGHAWHLYVVRLTDDYPDRRDEVMNELFDRGIGCSLHYVPLHRQPYWRDRYRLDPSRFPVSERLYRRGFSLPIYTRMTNDDQTRVIAAVREVLATC
jgi:dTDP-4-amino-4,6-dideoxygalactose transaminase